MSTNANAELKVLHDEYLAALASAPEEVRRVEADIIRISQEVEDHNDVSYDWEGPCLCQLCQSYGE